MDLERTCTQVTKAYACAVPETSYNQLLMIEFAMSMLKINSLIKRRQAFRGRFAVGVQ